MPKSKSVTGNKRMELKQKGRILVEDDTSNNEIKSTIISILEDTGEFFIVSNNYIYIYEEV